MTQEKTSILGFPGSSVVKNQPSNAGDRGSIPHLGRSHTPWTTKPRVPQLLRPTCPTAPAPGKPPQWEAHTAAREQEELSRNEDSTQPKKKKNTSPLFASLHTQQSWEALNYRVGTPMWSKIRKGTAISSVKF